MLVQKTVEAPLHALSARSEALLANCEKLRSEEDTASYARIASSRQLRRPEDADGGRHSLRLCPFVSRRLPSSSPLRCLDSSLLSGEKPPNRCFSRKQLATPTWNVMQTEACTAPSSRSSSSSCFVSIESLGLREGAPAPLESRGLWAAFAQPAADCKIIKSVHRLQMCPPLRLVSSPRWPRGNQMLQQSSQDASAIKLQILSMVGVALSL